MSTSDHLAHIVSRGHTRPLTEISFVEDGPERTLLVSSAHDKLPQLRNATASGDFSAKLWCATTGKELFEFKHKHVVKSVDFTNNTERIATGCQDGLLRIYDTCKPEASPLEIRVSPNKVDESITKIAWLDTNVLFVGKRNGVVESRDVRVDPETGPLASTTLTANMTVQDIEISHNHKVLITACGTKVGFLSLSDLAMERDFTVPPPMHFREEGGAALSPDGSKFLAGASDLWLREFDAITGACLRTVKGHHGPIRCVRYHPSGHFGASGSEDGTIRIWNLSHAT